MPSSEGMIRIEKLVKSYGRVKAVDGLDLTVGSGEVLALLGPNGAGKSTTFKALVGLVRPSAGRILVDGLDVQRSPREARRLMGYVPQRVAFHDNLTALEVLTFFARLRGADAAGRGPLLERVGLAHAANRRTEGFSGGMLQRLGLAVALLGDPRVLVLDEPTVGLDPEGALLFKDIIRERHAAGTTVLVSSHLLNETQALTDRVAICVDGRVAAQDTLENLRHHLGLKSRMAIALEGDPEAAPAIAEAHGARLIDYHDGVLRLELASAAKGRLVAALGEAGHPIRDLRTEEASLEEIFLATVRARKEKTA